MSCNEADELKAENERLAEIVKGVAVAIGVSNFGAYPTDVDAFQTWVAKTTTTGLRMTFEEWARSVEVLDDLPAAVKRERLAVGKSLRAAAREIGISFSTLSRFERSEVGVQLAPVRKILVWLARGRAS